MQNLFAYSEVFELLSVYLAYDRTGDFTLTQMEATGPLMTNIKYLCFTARTVQLCVIRTQTGACPKGKSPT